MKSCNSLISVILPVFNGEKFLSGAIESILVQTHSNFELLIIDDGSTDETLKIIKRYAKKDFRIKFRSRSNRGLIETLNELIDMAKGDYIARMDADDISNPDRLRMQLALMQVNNLDVCGTKYHTINEWEKPIKSYQVQLTHEAIALQLIYGVPFAHGSVMLKTSIAKKFHYDVMKFNAVEDYALWMTLIEAGARFGNVNHDLYALRLHGSSFSNTKKTIMRRESKNLSLEYQSNNREILQDYCVFLTRNSTNVGYTIGLASSIILRVSTKISFFNIKQINFRQFLKYLLMKYL